MIDAWHAWDQFPGDKARACRLADARLAYVGLVNSTALHAYIAAQRRAGYTVADAVLSWEMSR